LYYVSVKQGDLLDETDATFMINASNTRLILGSGVSMSFKRKCGLELQNEMNKSLKEICSTLQKGDVVITKPAKCTNTKYILHTAIMNYNKGIKQNDKYPTLQTIREALLNIEKYLVWFYNKHKTKPKLVLPLMGCGVGGLDKIEVIKLYKEFFHRKIDFLVNVVIYGYTKDDFLLLQKIIKA